VTDLRHCWARKIADQAIDDASKEEDAPEQPAKNRAAVARGMLPIDETSVLAKSR
jgi:hypothetical protein